MKLEEFKKQLRSLVTNRGLNYTKIENELNLRPKFLSRMSNDRLNICEFDEIPRIAKYFDIDLIPISPSERITKNYVTKKKAILPSQIEDDGNLNIEKFKSCVDIITNHIDSKDLQMNLSETIPLLIEFYKYSLQNENSSIDEFLIKSFKHH